MCLRACVCVVCVNVDCLVRECETLIINTRKHTDTEKKSATMRACTEKGTRKKQRREGREEANNNKKRLFTSKFNMQTIMYTYFGVYTLVDWPHTTHTAHFFWGWAHHTRVWPSECKSQPLAKCKQGSLIGIDGTNNDDADRCRSDTV